MRVVILTTILDEAAGTVLALGRNKQLASQFNFTYRYIDGTLSINNQDFENYLGHMYPMKLDIKDTTDLLLSVGRDGQLRTSLYAHWNLCNQ